jgi:hypothetical protein
LPGRLSSSWCDARGARPAQLGFWVGQTALTAESSSAFRHAVHSLSLELAKLARAHLGARTAGLVVDSKGWADADGYDALVAAGEALAIDTFVVLSDDRLFSRLTVRLLPACARRLQPDRVRSCGGLRARVSACARAAELQAAAQRRETYGQAGGPRTDSIPCARHTHARIATHSAARHWPPRRVPPVAFPRPFARVRVVQTYFAHRDVLVTRAAKSGGVVVRSQAFRRESQVEALRRYFYGIGGQLCPHLTVLAFSTVTLAALEAAPPPSADALPVGQTVQRHAVRLQRLADSAWPSMLKTVLAVLFAPHRADDGAILSAHMAGAVYVTSVDVENGRVTVLAPSPVALPGAVLLKGAQKWLEVSR